MRFLHDVARRLSIGAILTAVTAIGLIERVAVAQSSATQPPATQPPATQAPATQPPAIQRLPQPGRAAAAAGNRPQAQQRTPPGAAPRVATGPGQAAPGSAAPAAAAAPPAGPTPPFLLNSREQELLDKFLARWEEQNAKTKTFKCKFKRWEYDTTLTDEEAKNHLRSVGAGEVKYKQPDHGMFRILEETEFNGNEHKYEKLTAGLDHWVCDGTAIYEFVPAESVLKVHPLPKEMQGEAIADGPIPFIFGAKVDKMKQRYWIHEVTPKEEIGQRTWLEVFPKYQHDAVNFSSAKLVLNDSNLSIFSLEITQAGGSQQSRYAFSDVRINDKWGEIINRDFAAPKTPPGWTKVVDPSPDAPDQSAPQQPAAPAATAQQPKGTPAATAQQPKGTAPAMPAKR
jgi:TIGR03009 family protein